MPDPPLGTGSAVFAGGGAAHMTGPNALFVNPAALSIADGFQAEAGMMGLEAGFSPYFLYGASAGEHAAFALGYYYDGRVDPVAGGPARQGMIGGGSWDLDPATSLGLSVRTEGTGLGVGRDGFGVDIDAGLLWRPRESLWTGLAVRNLEQSGVGREPAGYETHRSYLAALGLRVPACDVLGIRLVDPDAFYEFRTEGFPPGNFVHAFSLSSNFTPGGKLGLRGTLLAPDAGQPGFALGVFLNFPAGKAGIVGGYVYDSGAGEATAGGHEPSHSLSLNFRLGADRDRFPPVVEVRADKLVLIPDSTGAVQVFFRLTASDRTMVKGWTESDERGGGPAQASHAEDGLRGYGQRFQEGRIQDWKLAVRAVGSGGQAGAPVKTYQGRDLPPKIIRWDGSDEAGNPAPYGFYAFRLSARDMSGNESFTVWQLLEIRAP